MRILALSCLFLSAALAAAGADATSGATAKKQEPKTEAVTISGAGGWKLAAFYAAPKRAAKAGKGRGPAVILTHMLGRRKEDWKPLLAKLTWAGYAVLACDMRGHGASLDGEGKKKPWPKFKAADWSAAEKDLLAARDWLLKEKAAAVDPERVALMGASIGANLSLRALLLDGKLRGAVLLSPGLVYRGVKTQAAAGKLGEGQKLALFAAKGDSRGYSARTVEALARAAGKAVVARKVYAGTQHGTNMFGKVKGVEADILEALEALCPPKAKKSEGDKRVDDALQRVL